MELLQGDCVEVMQDKLGENSVDLIITDPPYNIGKAQDGYGDDMDEEDYWRWMEEVWEECYRVLKPKCHLIFTCKHNAVLRCEYQSLCKDVGFTPRHLGVWHNPARKGGSFPGMWPFSYEFVFDCTKGGFRKLNNGNCVGYQDLWIEKPPSGIDHPTSKPVETWTELVELSSDEGDLVVDPFVGSGTTPLVSERLGRECIGIDINEDYLELAEERIGS